MFIEHKGFYLFFFLILFIFGQTSEPSGKPFFANFRHFDEKVWEQMDGSFHCTYHNVCAIAKAANYQYVYTPALQDVLKESHELKITLRNDCAGTDCCHESKCAAFTTGVLVSKETFGYGTFNFVAIAGGWNTQDFRVRQPKIAKHIAVISCLKLKASDGSRNEISFCFESGDPHTAMVNIVNNEYKYHKQVKLGFDSSYQPGNYRIDWQRETVAFVVNQITLKTVIGPHLIPSPPMRVRFSLKPKMTSYVQLRLGMVETNMKIFTIQYVNTAPGRAQRRDELITIGGPVDALFPALFTIFCLLSLIALVFICRVNHLRCKYQDILTHSEYEILDGGL